jgi:hypothetical protein
MSYTKKDLVICKKAVEFDNNFKVGEVYRCSDNIVYGYSFNEEAFAEHFDYLHDVVVKEWTDLGLIVDGKPVNKTKFKEWLDVHKYTRRGIKPLYLSYIGRPKESLYQFYPSSPQATKTQTVKDAYYYFSETVKGNVIFFDPVLGTVIRGNSGIPISYGKIYWRG